MSRGNIIRARIESLKTRGVKFTPSLEKLVRQHHDRFDMLMSDFGRATEKEIDLTNLDGDSVDDLVSEIEKLNQVALVSIGEESMILAEAVFAEVVRMFEELLTKPILPTFSNVTKDHVSYKIHDQGTG